MHKNSPTPIANKKFYYRTFAPDIIRSSQFYYSNWIKIPAHDPNWVTLNNDEHSSYGIERYKDIGFEFAVAYEITSTDEDNNILTLMEKTPKIVERYIIGDAVISLVKAEKLAEQLNSSAKHKYDNNLTHSILLAKNLKRTIFCCGSRYGVLLKNEMLISPNQVNWQ